MSKIVLTNGYVALTSGPTTFDISEFVSAITLSTTHDLIETTQMNDIFKTVIAGLGQNSVSFQFYQDFGDANAYSGLEQVIYPFIGTAVTCTVKPVGSATTSSFNPQYSFGVLISEWQPLSGAVGELSTASVTWPISGAITKTITP
jgi:hypothetical protein